MDTHEQVIMLNIQIDNPELEQCIKQTYGENSHLIAKDFVDFIQQQKIKQDLSVSIEQLDAGQGIPMEHVFNDISRKFAVNRPF